MAKEKEVIEGGPGDDLDPDGNPPGDNNKDDNNPDDDKKGVYVTQDQLAAFQQRQDKVLQMLEGLTRKPNDPQPDPKRKGKMIAGMDPAEFESLFWENPAAALEQYKGSILEEVRAETGKKAGETNFWTDFYSTHDDLKEEKDLVDLVLRQNYASLADLPVPDAKKKLADLTRQRILRYSGGKQNDEGKNKKVFTEGSEHRIPRGKKEEPEAPKTLGELIRARKAARRTISGKAVAT